MTSFTTLTNQTEIRVSTQLDTLPLTDDLFAIRQTRTQIVTGQSGWYREPEVSPAPTIMEKIVTGDNLVRLQKGGTAKYEPMVIFPDRLIEDIRLFGWVSVFDGNNKSPDHILPGYPRVRDDVFTAFLNNEAKLSNLVKPDFSNFYAVDCQGKVLPSALLFNYMHGYFDESHYDLEKAAEHLLSRSDVFVYACPKPGVRRGTIEASTENAAYSGKEAIQPIPYYNVSAERSQQIAFRWRPSAADYATLTEAVGAHRLGLTNLYYENIFKLDLLGLRAAGCAKSDSYF